MKKIFNIIIALTLSFSMNVHAESGYQLAQKHMCTYCHSLDRKLVGPTWMNVSLRYQNQPDAEKYLIEKIRTGGSGAWGTIKMPPSNGLSEHDIQTLAHYVLKLANE